VAELVRTAAPGIGDVAGLAEPARRAEQPDPVFVLTPGHPAQVHEVAGVHGEDQVIPGQPGRLELAGPVRLGAGAVVASAGQRGPGPRIHRVTDVPVPGPRAVHHDRAVQAGRGHFGAQDGLGHRRPADIAQADQADPVRSAGFARGRQLSR
jgi:hypothetical protein